MNYGLYLSANGAMSSMFRQDMHTNNLANMNTVAFKPDAVDIRQRLPARLEGIDGLEADPRWLMERLGGGHLLEPTRVSLRQGDLAATGNDLDLAIEGDGLFVIGDGGVGDEQVRLTRDGRFTLNADGELVMVTTGMKVLDSSNRPVQLERSLPVRFDREGAVIQNGAVVAELQIVATPDPEDLVKVGDNLMKLRDGRALDRRPASGRLQQGHTESAAVDPIMTMNAMMSAAKAAQANLRMIQYHDHLLGQAFNTFGRVG